MVKFGIMAQALLIRRSNSDFRAAFGYRNPENQRRRVRVATPRAVRLGSGGSPVDRRSDPPP
jgi:hypothetical protein